MSLKSVMFAAEVGPGMASALVGAAAAVTVLIGTVVVTATRRRSRATEAEPGAVIVSGPPVETPVLADDEPMICVLGPVQSAGADWKLTPQQLSLITYLACTGTAGKDAIVDALWDGRAVSSGRFPNLLAETRARIGRHHLPDAVGGRYRLSGVTTDLDRFEELIEAISAEPRADDDLVDRALSLVRGVPYTAPAGRHWVWLDARSEQMHRAELVVTRAVLLLAERYRSAGRLDRARSTLESGLLAAPLDQELTGRLIEVLAELGMVTAATRLVGAWEQQMARLDDCPPPTIMGERLRHALDRESVRVRR